MGILGKLFGSNESDKESRNTMSTVPTLSEELKDFLEEADELYIRAFETRSVGLLKEHFTRECCLAISRWIINEASSRFFGDSKFRNTTWELVKVIGNQFHIRKTCIYHDIRIAVTKTMKVSDDYIEEWIVTVSPDEYWVASVQMEES